MTPIQSNQKKSVSTQDMGKNTTQSRSVKEHRVANNPILSFILFVVALVIWFFVGNLFMQLAVNENFCQLREPKKAQPTGTVVAVIGDEKIYMSEINDYAKSIPQLADMPMDVIYPQLLETVVDSRVLKKAAEQAGTMNRPDVQQKMRLATEQVVAQAYLEGELKKRATPERIRALYETELKNFRPVEEVRAKHILVRTEQEAKDILIRLRAGGSFAMAANKFSLDQSTPDGDLGYFTEDMMIPEFSRAVFALQKGQISEPVKTPFGWHIILLEDRRMSEPPTFDEVRDELKDMLMKQDVSNVLADERAKLKVEIKKKKLEPLPTK